jgi:hypothetical protein
VKKLLVVAVVAALSVPLFALARHAEVVDPDDTKGLLDIRRVTVGGSRRAPEWTISTFARWTVSEIWDVGFFVVKLDTLSTSRADYYAIVSSNGRDLSGYLYKDRQRKPDRRLRAVRIERPDRRSVTIRVDLSQLKRRESRVYYWYAQTMFTSDNCRGTCIDRAPDSGTIAEPGPAPTETPSPTVPTP